MNPTFPRINYQGHKTLKQAEAERAITTTPRVDAVVERCNVRFSYQFAVEMSELAKTLERELAEAVARVQGLELIAQSARRDKTKSVPACEESTPAAELEALSNDEVYERLKRYHCFGMTTRER